MDLHYKTMKVKENLSLRKIADEYIMITDMGDHLDYTKAVSLNETAVYLIEASAGQDFDIETWVALLLERYEVEPEVARADVERLVESLLQNGIIE